METSNGNGCKISQATDPVKSGHASTNKRRKLTGRAFYQSLGSPKMILAPMVDQSEFVCWFSSLKLLNSGSLYE